MYGWHNRSLWYTLGLKQYDLVVTQKSYNCNQDELPSLRSKDVLFQNKAFEPKVHYPVKSCDTFTCVHDVVFVGAMEEDRLAQLIYLAQNGHQGACIWLGERGEKRNTPKFNSP